MTSQWGDSSIILAQCCIKILKMLDCVFITLSNSTYLSPFQLPYTQLKNTWIDSMKQSYKSKV